MAQAEAHAVCVGCHPAWPGKFRARRFYLARGCQLFRALNDYPSARPATSSSVRYGRYISQIRIRQILKPWLKLPGFRPIGAPMYDGTFPQALLVSTS